MALLDKLKSLLGLDDGRSGSGRQGSDEVGVTVEHDPGAAEPAEEEAPPASPAPGTEAAEPEPAAESEPEPERDADAGSTTDPDIDPELDAPPAEEGDDPSGAADEADGEPIVGSNTEPLRTQDPEPETEPTSGTEPADDTSASAGSDEGSVRDIKGIGPSYATKLSEAGVDSTSDLAAADAGELSEETGLSEKRIQGWIDRAQAR